MAPSIWLRVCCRRWLFSSIVSMWVCVLGSGFVGGLWVAKIKRSQASSAPTGDRSGLDVVVFGGPQSRARSLLLWTSA